LQSFGECRRARKGVVSGELDEAANEKALAAGTDLPLPTVLAALASILRDSTGRFEQTSDRIAQLVVARETGSGVDIIVALQEFDRLRQDFEAIEGILAGCAQIIEQTASDSARRAFRDVIAEIPVVDFKNRLARRLAWVALQAKAEDTTLAEEAVF
jgi:hypothetical protein